MASKRLHVNGGGKVHTQPTAAKERAGWRCQVCYGGDEQLEAHHRTYKRLGNEKPSDITVLCRTCHQIFYEHGRLKR